MPFPSASICILIVGECCLLLDLGNRLFGSYARSPARALVRILAIVAACILLALPMLWDFLVTGSVSGLWTGVSVVASVTAGLHYLFPCRFGIRRIASVAVSETRERLSDCIDLHSVTTQGQLPPERPAITCLVLTDLHCNSHRELRALTDALSGLPGRPHDLVVVLGDLGEKTELIPEILAMLGALTPKHGTFLVRSNHDCEGERESLIARFAGELSITVLGNAAFPVRELGISLVGLEYPWRPGQLPAPPDAPFSIGLTHTPDNITFFDRLGVPFVLAGHTHGGDLRLPLIGATLVPSRYGRVFDGAWFRLRRTVMHVCPGIGYFPGRLGNRGVILQLTIKPPAFSSRGDTEE